MAKQAFTKCSRHPPPHGCTQCVIRGKTCKYAGCSNDPQDAEATRLFLKWKLPGYDLDRVEERIRSAYDNVYSKLSQTNQPSRKTAGAEGQGNRKPGRTLGLVSGNPPPLSLLRQFLLLCLPSDNSSFPSPHLSSACPPKIPSPCSVLTLCSVYVCAHSLLCICLISPPCYQCIR